MNFNLFQPAKSKKKCSSQALYILGCYCRGPQCPYGHRDHPGQSGGGVQICNWVKFAHRGGRGLLANHLLRVDKPLGCKGNSALLPFSSTAHTYTLPA